MRTVGSAKRVPTNHPASCWKSSAVPVVRWLGLPRCYGSYALSVQSCRVERALADEVEVAAPVHLSPQHVQFADLSRGLPLAPRERQPRPHRCKVLEGLRQIWDVVRG